mgnify:CR=1 FL=1
MSARANDNGNNAKLTAACELAYEKFQQQLIARRNDYQGNAAAQAAFDEVDAFFNPLFTQLIDSMKAARNVAEQKELLLDMMRKSFNESMMVTGTDDTLGVANSYIKSMIDAYSAQVRGEGAAVFASKTAKLADPGGSFQAINDYMAILNMACEAIEEKPAAEVRRNHGIPMGPVTDAQRALLLKESQDILRTLGEPFIDKEMPFQPDMLAIGLLLIMDPAHIKDLMNGPIGDMHSLPSATHEKWSRLQRDYPDMARNVGQLIDAASAAKGRGRATLQ